jgi:DNA-binding transcriptional LysR family regulator
MQNRRIIEQLLRHAGSEVAPTLESDSIVVLFAHVRTGRWASVMPAKLAEVLGLTEKVRAIPIVEPDVSHSIGLVVPHRNPLTPLINALVSEAKQLAPILGSDSLPEKKRGKREAKAPVR